MPEIPEEGQDKTLTEDAGNAVVTNVFCPPDGMLCDFCTSPASTNCKCVCDEAGPVQSLAPIRYWNGEINLSENDLGAGGYGFPWGHTRIYSNRLNPTVDSGHGVNCLVEQWPHVALVEDPISGDSLAVSIGHHRFWFDEDGSDWTVRHGFEHTLEHDATNDIYTLTYPDGSQYVFNEHDQTTNPQGSFLKYVSPNGIEVEVQSYNTLSITEVQRSVTVDSTTTLESIVYDYFPVARTMIVSSMRR